MTMLLQGRAIGLRVPLMVKVRLYNALPPARQQNVYPLIAEQMRRQCQAEGINFKKAFPAPPPK